MTLHLMRGVRAALLLLLSCCAYHPGSFEDRTGIWPSTRATTSCLDLALARRDRPDVADTVIAYRIGNRCERKVVVDLASVLVIGRDRDGNQHALAAVDPRHELRPIELHALWSGTADIAYAAGDTPLESVCLDISRIDHEHIGEARWMCIAKETP